MAARAPEAAFGGGRTNAKVGEGLDDDEEEEDGEGYAVLRQVELLLGRLGGRRRTELEWFLRLGCRRRLRRRRLGLGRALRHAGEARAARQRRPCRDGHAEAEGGRRREQEGRQERFH